jgi:hypothetical protein
MAARSGYAPSAAYSPAVNRPLPLSLPVPPTILPSDTSGRGLDMAL